MPLLTFLGHEQYMPMACLLGQSTAAWAAQYKGLSRLCTLQNSPSWKQMGDAMVTVLIWELFTCLETFIRWAVA